MASYPTQTILSTRALIYASNQDVLVLQSTKSEAKLRFYNNLINPNDIVPGYVVSASNEHFTISKDSTLISLFTIDSGIPYVRIPGRITTNRLEVNNRGDRKGIVFADYNTTSTNQFAGIGFTGGQLQYQVPSEYNTHRFLSAADAFSSYEIARIQRSTAGVAQLGIGVSTIPSNVALQVAGNVVVSGNITFNDSKYVQLDPNTSKLQLSQLPDNTVLLNDNNQIDESVLPQTFNFQFLKAQKNVGIGTKFPLQKLHVKGSTYITERLGVGVTIPLSRLHIVESSANIPAVTLQNTLSNSVLRSFQGSNMIMDISSGVGIGTTIVYGKSLRVIGDTEIQGEMRSTSIVSSSLVITNVLTQEQVLNNLVYETVLRNRVPVFFDSRIAVSRINSGNTSNVTFESTNVSVQGDIFYTGRLQAVSDMRVKSDIQRIDGALDKLNKIAGYTFNMNGQRHAGVIAQEIANVLPEAVCSQPDSSLLSVSYNGVVAMMIECLKELHTDVKDIKKRLGI